MFGESSGQQILLPSDSATAGRSDPERTDSAS
jgi:hypothetical protein